MKSPWNLRTPTNPMLGVCLVCIWLLPATTTIAQPGGQNPATKPPIEPKTVPPKPSQADAPSTLIEIPEEPKTVDPATLMPKILAEPVTVSFKNQPLKDLAKWLSDDRGINVIIDAKALSDEGLLLGEPITDHLENAPLFLLLDRLDSLALGWYFADNILTITSKTVADEHTSTIPYTVGDLFDDGYKPATLQRTILSTWIDAGWEDRDAVSLIILGDVLFVRQTDKYHREVAGFLTALRKHGRRTFGLDLPLHEILRQKLKEKVTVDFQDTPLKHVVQELSRQVGADMRVEVKPLMDEGISELQPINLKMTDQPMSAVLKAILPSLLLDWSTHNGVLWITTRTVANDRHRVALFDVRDLCRNSAESAGLMRAIQAQIPGHWEDSMVGLSSPKPGVLVVYQTEQILDELLRLLESYRAALRISKPREAAEVDPKELITKYYRLQKEIAADIEKLLPELIQPESWKSPARPEAEGSIRSVASKSTVISGEGQEPAANVAAQNPTTIPKIELRQRAEPRVIPASVLIVHQTRENHEAIDKLVSKIPLRRRR